MDFSLQTSDFRLQTSDCTLAIPIKNTCDVRVISPNTGLPVKRSENSETFPEVCASAVSVRTSRSTSSVSTVTRKTRFAGKMEKPNYPSAILNVPVCRRFYNDWFDDCKEDSTLTINPAISLECDINFSDHYNDDKNLCENIWCSSFVYN